MTEHVVGYQSYRSRDGIPSSECTLNTSLQAKAVTISTSKTITICSLYLPPSENLNIVLLSRLIDQLPAPFVICGDFNGHSITWGCDKNNSRGDRIDDFITENNICLLNNGSYTYLHPATGTFTAIDLSLCSPDILMEIDFMVESDSYGSDQFPIILKIGVSLPDALPRWNLNRADWVQFDNLCKEILTLDTIELYDEPIVLFTDVLCNIAKSCMPRATAKQKKRCKPWFNTECKDALKARKSAVASFKTNITSENLSNFRIARAKARRACHENKRASWQQYVSRLNSRTTLKSTWDMVRRISGKYKASTLSHLKYNNNDITDVKEICNTLAERFAFNSSSDNYSHRFNRYRLTIERTTIDFDTNNHYSYNDVFTLHELKQAIKISRDTSPGMDTVHYQLLKHLSEDSLLLLLYIF